MASYEVWFTVNGERQRLGVRLTSEAEAYRWAQRIEASGEASDVQVTRTGG